MRHIDLVDVMIVLGMVMIGAGLGAYDWRLALVVCGALLVMIGLWLVSRAAGGGSSDG